MTFRIEKIVAFTSIDEDDEEGVCAFLAPNGTWMPLIGADEERITSLRIKAQEVATMTQRPVQLRRFTESEVIETIEPEAWDQS